MNEIAGQIKRKAKAAATTTITKRKGRIVFVNDEFPAYDMFIISYGCIIACHNDDMMKNDQKKKKRKIMTMTRMNSAFFVGPFLLSFFFSSHKRILLLGRHLLHKRVYVCVRSKSDEHETTAQRRP